MPSEIDPADESLIRRCLDGLLTEPEFLDFDRRLQGDTDFRHRYLQLVDMEAALPRALVLSEPSLSASLTKVDSEPGRLRQSQIRFWLSTTVAAASLLLAAWFWAANGEQRGEAIVESPELPDAAVVTHVVGVSADGLIPGDRLKPGLISVAATQVQIEFLNGAIVGLSNGSELNIVSAERATLRTGHAACRVPPRARGFVLDSEQSAVVDIGTEFNLVVGKNGDSVVGVTSGEVEVSLLGPDGNTLTHQRIDENLTARVHQSQLEVGDALDATENSLILLAADHTPLPVDDRYTQAVVRSNPILYWRFADDEIDGSLVRNHVGQDWSGEVRGGDDQSIRIENGHALFSASPQPRSIVGSEPIDGLNADAYSIEFWVKPDHLDYATVVGIAPESDPRPTDHLNVVEIATDSLLIHEPGAIRFLHRHPPGRNVGQGTNLFANRYICPGVWQHIVCVKTKNELQLFVGGELVRNFSVNDVSDESPYRVFVGGLRMSNTERQYAGCIDEFAVYLRALSDDEVRNHYELLQGRGA